jgi:hypothetical protein
MSRPHRERSVDQVLRRLASSGRALDGCPDAELLAALADDTLAADERRTVETHVADCHACQMLMAAVARAETSAQKAAAAPSAVGWWNTRRFMTYVVPASAAAIAVALWVAVPGQRTPLGTEQPSVDRQMTPASAPSEQRAEFRAEPSAPPPPPGTLPDAGAGLERRNESQAPALPSDAQSRLDTFAPVAEAPPRSTDQLAEGPGARGGDERVILELDTAESIQKPTMRPQAARAASDPTPAPAAGPSSDTASAPVAAPPAAPAAPPAPVSAPSPAAASVPVGRGAAEMADRRAAVTASAAPFDIASPDSRVRWRVGPGAIVARSTDGGTTWSVQQSGASSALTAGSSPAASTCWIVGRAGTVLRTVDGGGVWQRTSFPEAVDLTAVTASTALDAAVTTADGRRFRTTDGGRTWSPVRD